MVDKSGELPAHGVTDAVFSGPDEMGETTGRPDVGSSPSGLTVELIFVMCFLCFLAVVGSIGNSVVLYVFGKKKDKLTSNVFIIALASVDFITCLVVIPFTIFMEFVNFFITDDVCCKLYMFLITSNIPFSALNMVAIAVDRYLCICHPFLHLMTVSRAKVLTACLALVACMLGTCVASFHGVYDFIALFQKNVTASANSTADDVTEAIEDWTASLTPSSLSSTELADFDWRMDRDRVFVVNVGQCRPNNLLVDTDFQWYYQKLYTFMYPTCLTVVVVLYFLIYRSVQQRRAKRQKQKSKSLALVTTAQSEQEAMMAQPPPALEPSPTGKKKSTVQQSFLKPPTANGTSFDNSKALTDATGCKESLLISGASARNTSKLDSKTEHSCPRKLLSAASKIENSNWLANLKTAAMLFVVTVVFIVTFLPAFLMVLQIVPHNIIIFYMYFANNVANPVIYSFMNQNFRTDLQRIFCSNRS